MDGHKGLDPNSVDRVEQLRSQKGNVQERLSESYYRNLSCIKHALIIMGLLTYFILCYPYRLGLPGGLVVKNPPANTGDAGDMGSVPGMGRCPGGGHCNPLQYSCLENPWAEEPGGLQSIGSHP